MNNALLKTFAQKARTLLIDGVNRKLQYWGFDKDGKVIESPQAIPGGYLFREAVYDDTKVPHLWLSLEDAINKEGFIEVAERAAYTWFNRLIALKILGKKNYEQLLLEPVSVEEQTPMMVKRARGGQFEYLNKTEQERLKKVLTDYEKETQTFAILVIGFCHNHPLLNRVFGGIDDYTELLLPDDVLSSGGFLDLLNNGDYINDDDYRQVELIGWLYQFYISEKKDQIFKKFKDGKKAEAKDIPAATQIFTPNWIVKYMVENTVGKIWLEKHPHSPIKESLKYLVETANSNETPEPIIEEVKDLKLLDPASGSGHILVEGFELLYKMYLEEYYPADEAVESILQNNLYGLDIDLRAAQLAQFAVLIKAAQYHPEILKKGFIPHIYAMPAPVHFTGEDVQLFLGEEGIAHVKQLQDALHLMLQAQNLGSIMQFDISEEARSYIRQQLKLWQERKDLDLMQQELLTKVTPYLQVLEVLTQQYEAIAANPPYMGKGNMNGKLAQYVEKKYPFSKGDLYTVFIDFCLNTIRPNGYMGLINPPSWMFTVSYSDLRKKIIEGFQIKSFLNFGRGVFGADFGTVSYVLRKSTPFGELSIFRSLYRGKSLVDTIEKKKEWFADQNFNSFRVNQLNFKKIDTYSFAYWLQESVFDTFRDKKKLHDFADVRQGLATSDNDRFRRNWHEVSLLRIGFEGYQVEKKWFPYNSGGQYRKWYGNQNYVVNWQNGGSEIRNNVDSKGKVRSRAQNVSYYFKESISWSKVTIGGLAFRYYPKGFIFDVAGCSIFQKGGVSLRYLLGLLNSKLRVPLVYSITQSVNYEVGIIDSLPIEISESDAMQVEELVEDCIAISKSDWDRSELSWDFQTNDLIKQEANHLADAYCLWESNALRVFRKLNALEEELNNVFLKIYNLSELYDSTVSITDITIFQEELSRDGLDSSRAHSIESLPLKRDIVIQQLISYIIGCFMGRYRLDRPGLQVAHPNPISEELEAYTYTSKVRGDNHQVEIDEDGIIPLLGIKGSFSDDACNRVRQFLISVWGEGALTQNINFIQDCLNQDLEDYLLKKFWSYHVRVYNKKPIYWLFCSKKGAFQALVYMHRMNRFTAEKLRDRYLLKHIQFLEQEIARMEDNMKALSKSDQKELDQLRKDLQECGDYDLALKDIATKQIEFDLDDGVTRNYELFKGVVAPIK